LVPSPAYFTLKLLIFKEKPDPTTFANIVMWSKAGYLETSVHNGDTRSKAIICACLESILVSWSFNEFSSVAP
jgi:hypothetical protein